jgi:hypothetical protein
LGTLRGGRGRKTEAKTNRRRKTELLRPKGGWSRRAFSCYR